MLLKGDSRNLAYFSDIAEPFRSYNERKLRLINVKTNNAKVADGGTNLIARTRSPIFLCLILLFFVIYLCETFLFVDVSPCLRYRSHLNR